MEEVWVHDDSAARGACDYIDSLCHVWLRRCNSTTQRGGRPGVCQLKTGVDRPDPILDRLKALGGREAGRTREDGSKPKSCVVALAADVARLY